MAILGPCVGSPCSLCVCLIARPADVHDVVCDFSHRWHVCIVHIVGSSLQVLANDVRDAAREQVESMGAQFVAVDAQGIAGEGAGGYATAQGSG